MPFWEATTDGQQLSIYLTAIVRKAIEEKFRLLWKYIAQGVERDDKKETIFEKTFLPPEQASGGRKCFRLGGGMSEHLEVDKRWACSSDKLDKGILRWLEYSGSRWGWG